MERIKTFFKSKKNLRILYTLFTVIAIYYSIITGIYLIFLIPIIVMWLTGANGVEFFNVFNSEIIQRTDISYFTTGDIIDSVKLLFIIAILFFVVVKLKRMEKIIISL